VALVIYIAFASPHLVDGDSAEFSTLGALGGRAHPSGYPLYVLWLRAWSWLSALTPGLAPAHAAAIATAILGALTLGVLHAAARAWGARPAAAAIAVAIVGAAPLVLRYHCEAEVFALNGLVVGLVLWLAAATGPLRGARRGFALGLVAGLGLANHLTCVLVAPVGLLGVVRAVRESRAKGESHAAGRRDRHGLARRLAVVGLAVAGLAVGLLPYAYLAIADGPASWGRITALSDLFAFFLRDEYGGATSFVPGAALPWAASLAACFSTIARSWLWLPALAGVVVLAARIWRPAGESRWAWAVLAASFVLAGPVLATRFNVEPRGIGLYVVERFHLLPVLLLTIPVAAAIDLAIARFRTESSRRVHPLLVAALPCIAFVALSLSALPRLARIHSPAMELGVQNLLRSLPPHAIAVVISEDQCFGGRYLQLARGQRPDITLVCSELLRRDWYRATWSRRGLAMPADPGTPLGDALLRTGRPLFVDRGLTAILAAFPSYPFGVLYRVLPRGAAPPSAHDIATVNRDLYQSFDLDYPRPGRDDDFAAVAHRRYTAAWAAIANLLDASGDHGAARDALDLARQLQPAQDD